MSGGAGMSPTTPRRRTKGNADAEMQNLNNHPVEWHALPKRSRFYQASIDVDYLDQGGKYDTLPESSIMFICTFDPFKRGLSQYTFRERCDESGELLLDDGTVKYFFNCCYNGDDIPEDLKRFYEYIRSGKANSDLTVKLDHAVAIGRANDTWRTQYLKERTLIYDAIREEQERTNIEKQRADKAEQRANEEKKRADKAEKKIAELEALLAAK